MFYHHSHPHLLTFSPSLSLFSCPYYPFSLPPSLSLFLSLSLSLSQGRGTVNGAAILFRHPSHPYISLVMDDFVTNYDGNYWGQNGPLLMSRCLSRCNETIGCHLSVWASDHAYLLSYLDFQSHAYDTLSKLPKVVRDKLERVRDRAELVHFWNSVYGPVEDRFLDSLRQLPSSSHEMRTRLFTETMAGSLWALTCPMSMSRLLKQLGESK